MPGQTIQVALSKVGHRTNGLEFLHVGQLQQLVDLGGDRNNDLVLGFPTQTQDLQTSGQLGQAIPSQNSRDYRRFAVLKHPSTSGLR